MCELGGIINSLCRLIQWIQNSNTPCQQSAQVCGFTAGPQSNWLITQLINRTVNGTRLSTVSVQIEFELQGCDTTLNCQRTFSTYVYETASTDNAVRRNVTDYRIVQRVSPDVTSGGRVNNTVVVDFETTEPTFYFAIQDETSCIVIMRIIVFYHVCPSQILNLISTSEIIAPQIGAPPIQVTATCVDNAEIKSDSDPKLICSTGGIWSIVGNSGCRCQPGLDFINGTCLRKWQLTLCVHAGSVTDVGGIKDLWCSSTVRLLSTQMMNGVKDLWCSSTVSLLSTPT